MLTVQQAGALTLLQDAGRFGAGHLGITQGGAADWIAYRWANWLLGNPLNSAALEIIMGGHLTLTAGRDVRLALTGADLTATLDGQPLAPNTSFLLQAGQTLIFQQPKHGLRAYLAFPGGLDAPTVLGSRACTAREQIGGLHADGQPLQAGDQLSWSGSSATVRQFPKGTHTHTHTHTTLPDPVETVLSMVLGSQVAHFAGRSLFDAFNSPWSVDQRADRMGIRLTGKALTSRLSGIVSEGIPLGAIQVPPDGQPIILLNDRQTIGGYPRLGALTPIACARLSQCLPGTQVRLRPISATQAQSAYRQQLRAWE